MKYGNIIAEPRRITYHVLRITFLLVTCHLSLVTFCACADEPKKLEIAAKVDKEKVNIGDRIRLELSARNAAGMEVWFPEKPEDLGDFSFLSSNPPKKSRHGDVDQTYVYVLGVYTTGTHVIPPIQVKYRKMDGGEWSQAMSPQVPVEVETLLTADSADIRDLKGVVSLRSGSALKSLILTFLVLLAALGIYVWKKGALPGLSREKPGPRPAYEIALEELLRLKAMNLPEKGEVKEYYIRLSDIARRYLENRFYFRAPEMTTEEFLDSVKGSSTLSDAHRRLLEEFLSHCDMVKFAKYGPTPIEMLDSYKAAEKLVVETKPAEEEGAK